MAAMKDKPPQMVWALEKYARYVPEGDPTLLSFQENEKTGSWKARHACSILIIVGYNNPRYM